LTVLLEGGSMKFAEIWRRLRWWLVYIGPRRDVTVDTLNGRLTLDSKDWLIGKYLYVRGNHDWGGIQGAVELLRKEGYLDLERDETVLNVGANIGMTCIGLLKAGYFERAIAFEPAPNTYRLLVHNISQNGLQDRIQHFPFALSSVEGELDLELNHDNSGDNRIRQTNSSGAFREERRQTVKVPVKTLDHLLESSSLKDQKVDLVWVDIQGHEGHFFQGAHHFLSQGIPVVSEFWPYGIGRSGVSSSEFCRVASELFSHFYGPADGRVQKLPISELKGLFDAYSAPRATCDLIFVNERHQMAWSLRKKEKSKE
jgi:FkbM family methyltransferase